MKTKYDNIDIGELKKIVSFSDSFPDVTRKLGLDPNIGNTRKNIERLVKRNKISTTHFSSIKRLSKKYDKDILLKLVNKHNTFKDILLELDYLPVQSNYKTLKKYLNLYNINYQHILNQSYKKNVKIDYSEKNLRKIISESYTFADIKRNLGLTLTGGNNNTLRKYIKEYNIDISHFDPHKVRREKLIKHNTIPLNNILVENSTYSYTTGLKKRLYKEGLKKRKCELCDQGEEWKGKKMSLILDHINGINNDNRIENLRIVCPNCNATLDTHCGKNKKKCQG